MLLPIVLAALVEQAQGIHRKGPRHEGAPRTGLSSFCQEQASRPSLGSHDLHLKGMAKQDRLK